MRLRQSFRWSLVTGRDFGRAIAASKLRGNGIKGDIRAAEAALADFRQKYPGQKCRVTKREGEWRVEAV